MSQLPPPPPVQPPPGPAYQAPMGPTGGPGPLQKIKGPAMSLAIVGGISAVLQVLSIFANLFGMGAGMSNLSKLQDIEGVEDMTWLEPLLGGASIGFSLLVLCLMGLIVFGSLKMMKLESYGLSLTAAIIAVVPCTTMCCIGIPFGIWALVVMNQPDVKAAFS